MAATTFYNNHGTVIKISNTLPLFFAFFDNRCYHNFARNNHGLHSIRKFIDIKYRNALQISNFIEIIIIRDNFTTD